jgi:predicted HicB family RNase H-like nuclease
MTFTLRNHRDTFDKVLINFDDQVIVRKLLSELVPEDVKQEIVRRFNQDADEYNERCARLIKEEALEDTLP